ncbi:hypothetical protein HYY71_06910 [Candidatus Woesearchaeota archaeon]|nr:hypothetical protein [Candidatus Woesearchaeota archaeon]
MSEIFLTYGTGSRPKLNARVIALRDPIAVTEAHLQEVLKYSKALNLDATEFVETIRRRQVDGQRLSPEERDILVRFNSLLNLRHEEQVGLSKRFDGEAWRPEMYAHIRDHLKGVSKSVDAIRSTGEQSYYAGICEAVPTLDDRLIAMTVEEFEFLKANTARNIGDIKVPLDGPYMLAIMTLDRYFTDTLREKYGDAPSRLKYEAKRALTLAFAEKVVKPQVETLAKAGVRWIQLDEPAATNDIEHIAIVVDGINAVVQGIEGVKFSIHTCYPNRMPFIDKKGYALLFPHIFGLDSKVNHLSLELANGDKYEEDLAPLAQHKSQREFELGVGVTDIRPQPYAPVYNVGELAELVKSRLLRAANVMGDTKGLYASHDCGLRRVPLEYSFRMDEALVKGAELARRG